MLQMSSPQRSNLERTNIYHTRNLMKTSITELCVCCISFDDGTCCYVFSTVNANTRRPTRYFPYYPTKKKMYVNASTPFL